MKATTNIDTLDHKILKKLAEIIDCVNDSVYIVDENRRIKLWNKSAELLTGFSKKQTINKKCCEHLLNHVDANGKKFCIDGCPILKSINSGEQIRRSLFLHHKDGHRVHVDVEIFPLTDSKGKINGAIEVFRKAKNHCKIDKSTDNAQNRDELTGTWTKRRLIKSLTSRTDQLRIFGWNFAILFIDVDKFKSINDTYGHVIGDKMLVMIAKTLMAHLRAGDEIYRYGGEEFVIVLPDIKDQAHLFQISEKLRKLVGSCFLEINNTLLNATISIGGTIATEDDSAESLISKADKLMYTAKKNGRNNSVIDTY
ncbi:diguanylate cyclase [Desulfovibrio desulfuricans]|nr:diguanylate cyclase [Desulfovibrio desulfuricans]